ncbi:MAG: tRNA nuclease WapA [Fimbriimonadaceae bacterium]|nr:tRNA nuclease WapA [Fimbriimonadaceae bacterium]
MWRTTRSVFPAGNRANSGYSYDNLNRILASPNGGVSYDYDHDILGFRTWRNFGYSGVQRYLWDEVGRLKSCVGNSAGARYEYRADGMRIKKVEGLTIGWNGDEGSASGYYTEVMTLNAPTERYWYDGQMTHEEDRTFKVGSTTYKNITKYGLGARGLDYIHHWNDQTDTTTVGFPIYDGHGNMIATLARSGSSPYYSVGDLRLYDVWGSVRSGSSSGIPNQRYCANLGHRQDDESSLIYMRARYYEPGTGRYLSQDRAMDGANWYVYCGSNPVNAIDGNGEIMDWAGAAQGVIWGMIIGFFGMLTYNMTVQGRKMT